MITPPVPAATMALASCLVERKTPVRHTWTTSAHAVRSWSTTGGEGGEAGAVHPDVETAERLGGQGHQSCHVGLDRHVDHR